MIRHAIILSCEEYDNYRPTPYCYSDAILIEEALVEFCDYDRTNITSRTLFQKDTESTLESVLELIKNVICKSNPEDTILFYFAGHGDVVEDDAYLILPMTIRGEESTTALSIKSINNLFKEYNRHNFRILDACHSGFDSRDGSKKDFVDIIANQSWATLASCSKNEKSYSDDKLEQGIFTYYIAESIKEWEKNSHISIEGLKIKVCEGVKHWCEKEGLSQTPTLNSSISGNISIATRNNKQTSKEIITDEQQEAKVISKEDNMGELITTGKKNIISNDVSLNSSSLWSTPDGLQIPKSANSEQILHLGKQLKLMEIKPIVMLYQQECYEGASNLIWTKAMHVLRERVLSLGLDFVGEMVGIDDKNYIRELPSFEVINLASELGFINKSGKMRLSHANELVQHYFSNKINEEMPKSEIDSVIRYAIQYILGYDESNLKVEFVDFRNRLKSCDVSREKSMISMLKDSPYFYKKTTIRTLINLLEQTNGAEYETVVANMNEIILNIWENLMADEKYFIGMKYSGYSNTGEERYIKPLKSVLLKVHGFDYVPENLRSTTFIQAAKNLKRVHNSFDNFYNEPGAVSKLERLGTKIPKPAISESITATLMVRLGNRYGVSYGAIDKCEKILDKLSIDDWKFYLEYCMPTAEDVLYKLTYSDDIRNRWISIVNKYKLGEVSISNKNIRSIIASAEKDDKIDIKNNAQTLISKLN